MVLKGRNLRMHAGKANKRIRNFILIEFLIYMLC